MKFITALAIALMLTVPAIAQELPEGVTGIPGGAYLVVKTKKGEPVSFLVHTFDQLTKDKTSKYDTDDKRSEANALPLAKDLADRLLKISDVKRVIIEARRVEIQKYPLVPNYEGMKAEIIAAFEAVYTSDGW